MQRSGSNTTTIATILPPYHSCDYSKRYYTTNARNLFHLFASGSGVQAELFVAMRAQDRRFTDG